MVNKNEFVTFAEITRDAFLSWAEYLEAKQRPVTVVQDAMDKALEADNYAIKASGLTNKQFKRWYAENWGNWDVTVELVPMPPAINQLALFAA